MADDGIHERTYIGCAWCGKYSQISGFQLPCGRHWICMGDLDMQGRRSEASPAYEEWIDLWSKFNIWEAHVAEGCD